MSARPRPGSGWLPALAALVCLLFAATLTDVRLAMALATSFEAPSLPDAIVDRDGSIAATVLDEDGAPIAGASVRVFAVRDDRAYFAGIVDTDGRGEARLDGLPRGEAWVLAYAAQRARASTRLVLGAGLRDVRLVLAPATALDVVVVDDGERPVAGAALMVTTADPLPHVARSAQDGTARVDRLGPAPYVVRASAPGFDAASRTGVAAGPSPLRVRLTQLGSIVVTVLGFDGSPAEGATVLAAGSGLWPARSSITSDVGVSRITGLRAGVYDLKAQLGDLVSPTELAVALGRGESKAIELQLEPGRRVAVTVTDGEGDDAPPIAGASVVLVEGGLSSFPIEGRTDAEGKVSLGPIANEAATVGAHAKGFIGRGAVAVAAADVEARITLLRGGVLLGDVVDERGYPVDGATLEVIGVDGDGMPIDETTAMADLRDGHFELALAGPMPLRPAGELGVMPGPVPDLPPESALNAPDSAGPGAMRLAGDAREAWVTRADGTFRLEPVPPGRVHVIVRHPSYVETLSGTVTLAPSGEATLHIVMREGGSIEGRVLDAERRPVPGARIELAATQGSLERVTYAADDGAFAFAAVPDEVLLSAARPERPADPVARLLVDVGPRERKEVEIVLPAVRDTMAIHVTDDRGYPLDRVEIHAVALDADATLRATLFTNDDGDAELPDAVGLPLRLTLFRPQRAPKIVDLDAAPTKVDIELGRGLEARGRVTSRSGRDPAPGAEIVVYMRAGVRRTQTDVEGAFALKDLPPGRVRVAVTHDELAPAELVATIVDDPESPTDLGVIDLAEAGEVAGSVVDDAGHPVAGARVAVDGVPTYLPLGPLPPGVVATDKEGRFTLRGVREGAATIEAFAADLGRGTATDVAVQAGRTTTRVTVVLPGVPSSREAKGAGSVAVTLGESTASGRDAVVVVMVPPGSEAELAGIEPGDEVRAVDGQAVASMEQARKRLTGPLGEDVIVTLARDEGSGARTTWLARVRRERVRR